MLILVLALVLLPLQVAALALYHVCLLLVAVPGAGAVGSVGATGAATACGGCLL
jgi:hypothetical protein